MGGMALWPSSASTSNEPGPSVHALTRTETANTPEHASPQLTPEAVVNLQIEALRKSIADPAKVSICFQLASPSNRAFTGPLERFAEMVRQPPFSELAEAEGWQMGKAQVEGERASVLATTCNRKGLCTGFRFWLSLQKEAPFTNCWMTDEVEPLALVDFRGVPISDKSTSMQNDLVPDSWEPE